MSDNDKGEHSDVTDSDELNSLQAYSLVANIAGVGLIFIAASYFAAGQIATMLSHFGADLPAGARDSNGPPFGVHYFGDLFEEWWRASKASPWASGSSYPPLVPMILKPFTYMSYGVAFTVFIVAPLIAIGAVFWRNLRPLSNAQRITFISAVIVISQPIIAGADRGNLILLTAVLSLGGYVAYTRKMYYVAAVLFGLAACLKVYPALLLLLLVRMRKWKPLAAGVLTGVVLTVLPLVVLGNGLSTNISDLRENLASFREVNPTAYLSANMSIRGLLEALHQRQFLYVSGLWEFLIQNLNFIVVVFFVACVFVSVVRSISIFEVLLTISCSMYLVMDFAAPYSTVFLLLPVLALCMPDAMRGIPTLYRHIYLILIAVILAPKSVPLSFWNNTHNFREPTLATVVTPIAGVICVGLVVARAIAIQRSMQKVVVPAI